MLEQCQEEFEKVKLREFRQYCAAWRWLVGRVKSCFENFEQLSAVVVNKMFWSLIPRNPFVNHVTRLVSRLTSNSFWAWRWHFKTLVKILLFSPAVCLNNTMCFDCLLEQWMVGGITGHTSQGFFLWPFLKHPVNLTMVRLYADDSLFFVETFPVSVSAEWIWTLNWFVAWITFVAPNLYYYI